MARLAKLYIRTRARARSHSILCICVVCRGRTNSGCLWHGKSGKWVVTCREQAANLPTKKSVCMARLRLHNQRHRCMGVSERARETGKSIVWKSRMVFRSINFKRLYVPFWFGLRFKYIQTLTSSISEILRSLLLYTCTWRIGARERERKRDITYGHSHMM